MTAGSEQSVTLYLIRHGESVANVERRFGGHSASPLTELGARQASATGERLAAAPLARIVASDLTRATQTAEAIAGATGAELMLDAGLRERSLGVLDGMTFDNARARHPELFEQLVARDPEFLPPEGESITDVYDRVSAAIDDALQTALAIAGDRTSIAIVSHAIALNHAIAHILGLGSPAHRSRVFVRVNNCSVSTFHWRSGGWVVSGVNDCGHLDPLSAM